MNALNIDTMYERLSSYVIKYCATLSTETALLRDRSSSWDQVHGPFAGITQVKVSYERPLNGHTLNRLFPNMRSLSFGRDGLGPLNNHFPRLEDMTIQGMGYMELNRSEMAAFDSFIRLNPQIRKLKIPFSDEVSLQRVNKHLPLLEDLTIHICPNVRQNTYMAADISHFKSVKKFTVIGNLGTRSPCTFDELEEFRLRGSLPKGIRLYHKFLVNNPTIRKLAIESDIRSSITEKITNIHNLVSSLPLLEELDISPCNLTPDGAIYLMNNLKNLRKFEFFLNSNLENKRIKAQVGREWQGSKLRENIYLFVRK